MTAISCDECGKVPIGLLYPHCIPGFTYRHWICVNCIICEECGKKLGEANHRDGGFTYTWYSCSQCDALPRGYYQLDRQFEQLKLQISKGEIECNPTNIAKLNAITDAKKAYFEELKR